MINIINTTDAFVNTTSIHPAKLLGVMGVNGLFWQMVQTRFDGFGVFAAAAKTA